MRKVKVFMKSTEELTYDADCVRDRDECGGKGAYTEVLISTERVTPEYGFFGNFKRDWKCWSFTQVALIKTNLIDRIELTD